MSSSSVQLPEAESKQVVDRAEKPQGVISKRAQQVSNVTPSSAVGLEVRVLSSVRAASYRYPSHYLTHRLTRIVCKPRPIGSDISLA
jgi:hypothetical protein